MRRQQERPEMEAIASMIANAGDGLFFLMFTPGEFPLLIGPRGTGSLRTGLGIGGTGIAHGARVVRTGVETGLRRPNASPRRAAARQPAVVGVGGIYASHALSGPPKPHRSFLRSSWWIRFRMSARSSLDHTTLP